MHVLPRIADVVLRITSLSLPYSERFLVDRRDVDVVLGVFRVQRDEMRGQLPVQRLDRLVQDEIDQVEAGEQRGRELQVLHDGEIGVVARIDGIGGGEDRRTRVQRADNARFRDGNGLLLHGFVQNRARGVVHLVELVDAADSFVAQHQRAALQNQIVRLRILFSTQSIVATRVTYAVSPTAELPFPDV